MNNPADTLAALAPCPFCGGDARIDEGMRGYPCILCGTCGASSDYASTDEVSEAIAAWNRRASLKGEAEPVAWRWRGNNGGWCYTNIENTPHAGAERLYTTPPAPQAVGYERGLETPRRMAAVELLQSQGWKWDKGGWQSPAPAPQGGGERGSPLSASLPERIWLQVDTDADPEDTDEPFTGDLSDLSWCAEEIGGLEVEYVRADLATPPAQQPGEVGEDADEIAELRRNYDGAKRWLFALAMEQGGSVTVSRQTLYRMRPDDRLTMMESPSGDAYRLTAALAPKEKGNGPA